MIDQMGPMIGVYRDKIRNSLAIGALFLSFVFSGAAVSATLYKWIDENGEVRYSDRLPPNQVKHKREVLNEQGVVIETRERAMTEEERAAIEEAKQAEEARLAEEKRKKAEQDKHDRVLLLTFSSEEEMMSVRDNRIDVIDSVIRLIRNSIATTEERLTKLENTADTLYLSKGKEVPGGLAQNIEFFTRKIANRQEQLRLKEAEKQKIDDQFDADIERYRWLKSGTSQ